MTTPTGSAPAIPDSVLVIGSGLIGASIGLALRAAGLEVWLDDADTGALRVAVERGAGRSGRPPGDPDLVVVAVHPAATAQVVEEALRLYVNATVSDVASTKTELQREIEARGVDLGRFVPGHPLAGREVSGPAAARADLFADRVWALAPGKTTDPRRTASMARSATLSRITPLASSPR